MPVRVHRVAAGVYHGTLTFRTAGDYVLFDRSAALATARHVTAPKYPAPLNLRVGSSPGSVPDATSGTAAASTTAPAGGSTTGGPTSVDGGASTPAGDSGSATKRHLLEWAVATFVLLAIIGFGTQIRAAASPPPASPSPPAPAAPPAHLIGADPRSGTGHIYPAGPRDGVAAGGGAVMSEQKRIAVAEAIGTLILVVGGPGTAVLATGGFFPGGRSGCWASRSRSASACCARSTRSARSLAATSTPPSPRGCGRSARPRAATCPTTSVGQVVGGIVGAVIIFVIANSHDGFQREGERLRIERLRRALTRRVQAAGRDPHRDRVHRAVRVRHREHESQVDGTRLHGRHDRPDAHA